MPYYRRRRTYRSKRPRKRYNRRRRNAKKGYVARVPRTTVFPRRLITRLKYSDVCTMALTGGGGMTTYLFNMNSLYDPDVSSTGHQPYLFDETMALYSRYRVYKCSWHISIPSPPTVTDPITVSVSPTNGSYNPVGSPQSELAERPMTVTKTTSAGAPAVSFKGKSYLPKLNGVKPAEYKSDDRFEGTATTSPAETIQLIIGATCQSNCTLYATVTLVYYAEFMDPNIVASS